MPCRVPRIHKHAKRTMQDKSKSPQQSLTVEKAFDKTSDTEHRVGRKAKQGDGAPKRRDLQRAAITHVLWCLLFVACSHL